MENKWLEDLVVLAETRSFSRAALMRNITQPAFSRRIQALEAWMGVDLIVRSSYPPSLTPAGENFYAQAKDLMVRIGTLRSSQTNPSDDAHKAVGIAIPHTLSLTFFPQWLTTLTESLGPLPTNLRVGNVLDVVLWLVEGGCDLLICYHHPQQPIQLDVERYDMLTLGTECLAPYAAVNDQGQPCHTLPGKSHKPVAFLGYSSSAYLERMTEIALTQGRARAHLHRMCETDMAEGLRRLVLAGHGLAFLPDSVAQEDVAAKRLVRLPGGWEVQMEIRAYRERPTVARPARRRVEQLWQLLEARHASSPGTQCASSLKVTPRAKAASGSATHHSTQKEKP
jgi:DNA-binding transcriptional LysR family regulator